MGGVIFATLLPGLLIPVVGYKPIFLTFGAFHLMALLCVHVLMRDLTPVRLPGNSLGNTK